MSRSAFCQLCGQRISGKAISYHHPQWPRGLALRVCQNCERDNPHCRICGLPLPSAELAPGDDRSDDARLDRGGSIPRRVICETCQKSVKICLSCGEEIRGRYLEFDGVGPYCQNCQKRLPPCDICSAPLTREHWLLSDGRTMCTYCHATAVYEPGDATVLYEEMKTVAAQLLGLSLNVPTGLALVDRNQLAEVIRGVISANPPPPATTEAGAQAWVVPQELDAQRTLGIYARKGMRRGIYIQTGLPRLLFLQVAAHEYAHAWQGENCPLLAAMSNGSPDVSPADPPPPAISSPAGSKPPEGPTSPSIAHEGFAEWVAYKVLGHYGYHRGQERMLARMDIYGQGLRWALELEKNCGTQGVLNACRLASVETGKSGEDEGCGGADDRPAEPADGGTTAGVSTVRGQHDRE